MMGFQRPEAAAFMLALSFVGSAASTGPAIVQNPSHRIPSVDAAAIGAGQLSPLHYARSRFVRRPMVPTGPLTYHGGPIQKIPKIYVTFWGSTWRSDDPSGEAAYLTAFLTGIGGSSWLNTVAQYYDNSHGSITNPPGELMGTSNDTSAAPLHPSPRQVADEAVKSAAHFGYSADAMYLIATAHGRSWSGFLKPDCSYHNTVTGKPGTIAFINFPYMSDAGVKCGAGSVNNPGTLDGVSIIAGHEVAETQTDSSAMSWYSDVDGSEIGDLCLWQSPNADVAFSTGTFAVQPLWSNASNSCVLGFAWRAATLYSFQGGTDGAGPVPGVITDKTGVLYGATQAGGAPNSGTAFRLTPSSLGYTEHVLYTFGVTNGAAPEGSLIADKAGALYGATHIGGFPTCGDQSAGCGTVFKLTPSRTGYTESFLYSFQGGTDGTGPLGNLIADKTGALFGTTQAGGASNSGTVFKMTPSGKSYTESVLYFFQAGNDGAGPSASLVADKTGALFGTTSFGGVTNGGTVFKLTPSGSGYSESILYAFRGGNDGAHPSSSLIADKAGALYGTTPGGGVGYGTVFVLTPSGSGYLETVLYRFQGGNDGGRPVGGLYADKTGTLWGATLEGGTPGCNCGTVFKLTPSSLGYAESVLYRFGGVDGAQPEAGLITDKTGALYGTTDYGGALNFGTVFKLTP
jgi:uncharacterized repeat protein (TIGR03803 family)